MIPQAHGLLLPNGNGSQAINNRKKKNGTCALEVTFDVGLYDINFTALHFMDVSVIENSIRHKSEESV